MAGIISVRFTNAERKKLIELKQQRGYRNLSETIRSMLGFPRSSGIEGFEGADDIDGVTTLCKLVVQSMERQDDERKLVTKIARALHVELERPTLAAVRSDYVAPVVPVKEPDTGPLEVKPMEYRNGHKHPALPEGFVR